MSIIKHRESSILIRNRLSRGLNSHKNNFTKQATANRHVGFQWWSHCSRDFSNPLSNLYKLNISLNKQKP